MSYGEPEEPARDEDWDDGESLRWPLTWRGLYPRERWLWFERLWADVGSLRRRYRLPVRSGWWEDEIQIEALAALAAWTARYDSGEWDDPPGKLALLGDLERVAALLRDGMDPFHSERDRPAFVAHLVGLGAYPRRTECRERRRQNEPVTRFEIGATVTVEELDRDPYPVLARLRESEPVSWLPALNGWLVTRYDLVLAAMRDALMFTVDDPRFSTAQVIGPSMLSLDGDQHARHRAPFTEPFRAGAVKERFAEAASREAEQLVDELAPLGRGELRRGFAGPMSAAIVTRALGLKRDEVDQVLVWYDAIVGSVTDITAGRGPTVYGEEAFASLEERLQSVIAAGALGPGGDHRSLLAAAAADTSLSHDQIISNAAVLLFGGIETHRGHDCQRGADAAGPPRTAGPGPTRPGAARGGARGIVAVGAGGRGNRPLCHR